MKRRLFALFLALVLPLSGCAVLLEKDFVDIRPHAEYPATEEDPSVLRPENYQKLVDGIIHLVDQGLSKGIIRLSNYKLRPGSNSVEDDLSAACYEVKYEYPRGAYAVDYIRYETTYMVSYYEAGIFISYRRTQDQVRGIVTATGSTAIREELRDTLASFGQEAVLQVSYFDEDEDYITDLARQAYYDTPMAAMGMPDIQVSIYPALDGDYTGNSRIVEILLTYPEDQETLRRKSAALTSRANALSQRFSGLEGEAAAAAAFDALREDAVYIPAGTAPPRQRLDTAYAALVDGRADSEGMALALQIYCKAAGVESRLVSGTLDGAEHFWNIIAFPGGEYRHADATREDGFALHDADLAELGYAWDRGEYPACGNQPIPGEEPPPEEDALIPSGEARSEASPPEKKAPAPAETAVPGGYVENSP